MEGYELEIAHDNGLAVNKKFGGREAPSADLHMMLFGTSNIELEFLSQWRKMKLIGQHFSIQFNGDVFL